MLLFAAVNPSFLQAEPPKAGKVMKAQRKYDIIVNQTNDTLKFNRNLRALKTNPGGGDRGIIADLLSGYLSLGTSTLMSASQNLLNAGVAYIKEAARDKRPDWESAARGENRFVKKLPMVTEVLDFYGSPSKVGALDPTNMKFSGFGCRQYMTILDDNNEPIDKEVFYISCSVRDDESGMSRILNHSKFEVVVDELRFDPFYANLPNDTLSISEETKYKFDFNSRKDLEFKMTARLYSSWINEAIQINKDVPLGEFTIVAKIDPLKLDTADNVFRYSRTNPADKDKVVYATGDAFIVPRSFVGSSDMYDTTPSWGTGQYRVEMDIEESCNINENYYKTADGKWIKERWQPEWKMMKKRPKRGRSQNLAQMMFPQFSGDQWITTIIEPAGTVLITNENKLVNKGASHLSDKWNGRVSPAQTPNTANPQIKK